VPVVRFFTREHCGLCKDGLEVVEREMARAFGPPRLAYAPCTCGPTSVVRRVEYVDGSVLQVIDVDGEPELKMRFGFEVPVVEVEGGPTFSLQLDARALAGELQRIRAMEATP